MKMLGTLARLCDHKGCTCNSAFISARPQYRRAQRRRERQAWKKEIRYV